MMLEPLRSVCMNCTMCPLGRAKHVHNNKPLKEYRVFSTMTPSKFVVLGQNPGYNECVQGKVFVGDAGKNLNKEIEKHGLTRDSFYISNAVKCHTPKNRAPQFEEASACASILRLELSILRPLLVVTLGASALDIMCPGIKLSEGLGHAVESKSFGVKVLPIYHPSPRNLTIQARRNRFEKDIRILCKLVNNLKDKYEGVLKDL